MVSSVFIKGVLRTLALSLLGVAPLGAQEATFTDLHDLVPDRCFSAALTTLGADSVDIGIESGYSYQTWTNKACKASTGSFHVGSVSDTFTVTVTAPTGMRIARVSYEQAGWRYLERSTYWSASGTGTLTVNGVPLSFSFMDPTLNQTVDLSDQNVESTTISVAISLKAKRNGNFPRVKAAPGSATLEVSDAVIRVQFDWLADANDR